MERGRNDSRDDTDGLKPLVASLLGKIDNLLDEIKRLNARIAELEARNSPPPKTPDNSSVPPSSGQKANADALATKKARKGRAGVARALCENPDVTRDVYAERCVCGTALSTADQAIAHAYDHIDLPPIKPITTRINLHKTQCPCCRRRVAAKPPSDMQPGSPFGPGIVALVVYLHACQMISYARMIDCEPTVAEGRKLCDAIDLEARDKLFVFLTRRDIEPTNNASERALRMSVIFRKVTNGFRSDWGAKVYADACSIIGTARIAGRTALAAIRAVLARPAVT